MNQRWSTDLQLPLHTYSTNWPIPLLCSLSMSVPWMKNMFTFSVLIWNGLIDMVRNKNFKALHQSGGVKTVVVVLETNIKGIISGNGAALIHRENFLVPISSKRHLLLAKKYKNACLYSLFHQKPPQKIIACGNLDRQNYIVMFWAWSWFKLSLKIIQEDFY